MRRLILLLILLSPLTIEATTVRYTRGYSELWCEDRAGVNRNDPKAIKGTCYGVATTPSSVHPVMSGMKTRSAATLRGPTGITSNAETGLVLGGSVARVSVPYYRWDGFFDFWVQVGQVYCPAGTMTKASLFYARRKQLGVSNICVVRDGNVCKPVKPIIGPQLGWNCGYFPKEPCPVKCVAIHYTIYVVGASTVPANTGTVHKGWDLDPDTGVVTCTGYIVSFIPDGIPGILPCKQCSDQIIFLSK